MIKVSDLLDEAQITEFYQFQNGYALYPTDDQQPQPQLEILDHAPTQNFDTFKKIFYGTRQIYEQCYFLSELMCFITENRIHGFMIPPQDNFEDESAKILACKLKTLCDICEKTNNSVLEDFLIERKKEEDELVLQIDELKRYASFSNFNSLSLFSRACPLSEYFPNSIYMNLFTDNLWTEKITSKDLFHVIERIDAKLQIKPRECRDQSRIMKGEFHILIKKGNEVIITSGPAFSTDGNHIRKTRDKYLENVLILEWLKQQQSGKKLTLFDDYTIEFCISNLINGQHRKPRLYRVKQIYILKGSPRCYSKKRKPF